MSTIRATPPCKFSLPMLPMAIFVACQKPHTFQKAVQTLLLVASTPTKTSDGRDTETTVIALQSYCLQCLSHSVTSIARITRANTCPGDSVIAVVNVTLNPTNTTI